LSSSDGSQDGDHGFELSSRGGPHIWSDLDDVEDYGMRDEEQQDTALPHAASEPSVPGGPLLSLAGLNPPAPILPAPTDDSPDHWSISDDDSFEGALKEAAEESIRSEIDAEARRAKLAENRRLNASVDAWLDAVSNVNDPSDSKASQIVVISDDEED
jgi:hypothetical protein